MTEMLWKLRLKLAQGVDDVVIRTDIDDEQEARRVADAYVLSLASPAVRFVYVRRFIVAQSASFTESAQRVTAGKAKDADEQNPPPKPPTEAEKKAAEKSAAATKKADERVPANAAGRTDTAKPVVTAPPRPEEPATAPASKHPAGRVGA